jgi:hypothetical protein
MGLTDHEILRHGLAVIAYRGAKSVRGTPDSFANFDAGGGVTPLRILSHIGDLMEWALSIAQGSQRWNTAEPAGWTREIARFHLTLATFDTWLATGAPLQGEVTRLMAGPIDDALTHVGQIAMLRRMAGCAMLGENYHAADIAIGRVGKEQTPAIKPFSS